MKKVAIAFATTPMQWIIIDKAAPTPTSLSFSVSTLFSHWKLIQLISNPTLFLISHSHFLILFLFFNFCYNIYISCKKWETVLLNNCNETHPNKSIPNSQRFWRDVYTRRKTLNNSLHNKLKRNKENLSRLQHNTFLVEKF